ncbi:MAG: hypothetical protein ACJ79S_19155 [Gemmatimonadaceae bacterium]
MSARRGRSSLGCLFVLLLFTAAGYFAVNVGEVYLRYYRFRDGMQQQVRFARMRSDAQIRRDLAALADSIGLPADAGAVNVRRTADSITVWSDYTERMELPLVARDFGFSPLAAGPL